MSLQYIETLAINAIQKFVDKSEEKFKAARMMKNRKVYPSQKGLSKDGVMVDLRGR